MKRGWFKGSGYIYFVTNTVRFWLPVFCYQRMIELIVDTWTFFRRKKNIQFYAYVIMPDHLHYLSWVPPGDYTLSDFQRDFKKYVSRQLHGFLTSSEDGEINTFFKQLGYAINSKVVLSKLTHPQHSKRHGFTLWRADELPKLVDSKIKFERMFNYIHMNPVRKELVTTVELYPFSSAFNKTEPIFIVDELSL